MSRAQLELLVRDTKLQAERAEDEASELTQVGCAGYIGPWDSGSSIEVAKLLSAQSINRAMIGYSAGSPQLSKPRFSNYVRTNPGVQMNLVIELIKGLWLGYSRLYCDTAVRSKFLESTISWDHGNLC